MDNVKLNVGDHTYVVSEELLSKESDYFKALLQSGMLEAVTKQVTLPDFDKDTMGFIVNFIERGTLDKFDVKNVQPIMEAVSYLQMAKCTHSVTEFLKENMTVDNSRKLIQLANEFYNEELKAFAENFLSMHINDFCRTSDFKSLTFEEATEILDKEDLYVSSEKDVFDNVVRYISSSNCDDSKQQRDLIATVRFPLLQGNQFTECVETLKAMGLFEISKDYVEEARRYHENPYIVHTNKKKYFRPRRLIQCIVAVGGFTGREHSTNRFQIIPLNELQSIVEAGGGDIRFRSMKQPKLKSKHNSNKQLKLPTALCEHCVCVLDNFLYVAGGQTQYCQDGRYTRNTTYRLDPANCSWVEVCPMKTPRSLFYLGCLEGKLYAVGGWTAPDTVTRRVECYHPTENRWTSLASLPLGLHEHTGCIANGVMFVSGGYKGPYRGHLDKLWSYDVEADTWVEHKAMNHARSYHSMVPTSNNQILVAGGVNYLTEADAFEDVKDCELYDIATDTWSTITQTLRCTSCAPTLVLGDLMVVIGGHSFEDETDHKSVQILNMRSYTWHEKAVKSNNILYFATENLDLPEYYLISCGIT